MHRVQFPPLYGRLVGPGEVRNLPGVLFNLGATSTRPAPPRSHLAHARLSVAVTHRLAIVLTMIGLFVLPKFEEIYKDFALQLPAITQS